MLGTGAHVRCHGKGPKQRAVALTNDAQAVLATWLGERADRPHDPLFATRTGRRLSRDAVEQRVSTHAKTTAIASASLKTKQLHPHMLRHSCAMSLLQAGVDSTVIAPRLGHADVRSTQPYLHFYWPTSFSASLTSHQPGAERPRQIESAAPPDLAW